MKIAKAVLFGTLLLAGVPALAQRADVFGEYSYLHFTPGIDGLESRSFNGGGGGADLYFLKIFGIKADFMGYASTTFTSAWPIRSRSVACRRANSAFENRGYSCSAVMARSSAPYSAA